MYYYVYKDSIKSKTQSRQKTQKIQVDETVFFQKSRYEILTYINPFEKNNDPTWISHEVEFRSSFKDPKYARNIVFLLIF